MGGSLSLSSITDRLFGRRQINRQQNPSESSRTPLLSNTYRSNTIQGINRKTRNNRRNISSSQHVLNPKSTVSTSSSAGPASASAAGPATATAGPASTSAAPPVGLVASQPPPLTPIQIKQLECMIYEDFFKKTQNIKQIHQRHATTCANILNKGVDASIGDIKELAPNTSLTGIGIQQCMQVSDFLLYCKSKNVNYITSQDYSSIDELKSSESQSQSQPQPQLRPMVIFCCSELLRTQQTLFISYFDIIKDYLENGRKVIVLFWLNEQHFSKSFNADNFVVSLEHTKKQWRYFINRIINLDLDKNFMEDIGRDVGNNKIEELSKKLKLESGERIDKYGNWESIFYVSPIVYFNNPENNHLLPTFSFDNRRFTGKYKFFSKQTVKAKTLFNPEELYKVLPRILAEYILRVGIIGKDKNVGFYEEELSQDVKMNLVFVSHHNSCENTLNYLTGGQSKRDVFNKQQLMNAEIVILPKSGILWSQEYSTTFTDNDFKVDNIRTVNMVRNELINIENDSTYSTIKNVLKKYYNNQRSPSNPSNPSNPIKNLKNRLETLSPNSVNFDTLQRVILYFKYLNKPQPQPQSQPPQPQPEFSLNNRIFPVGFYNSINKTIERKNKTGQSKKIYPLFILYNSQLGIFFTPLDVVKQEVAIIEQPTEIQSSNQIFSLSSPFDKFLNMKLEDYIKFLEKSNEILMEINNLYNPPQSVLNVPAGVASAAVERLKRNNYFYDYQKLIQIVDEIKKKIGKYNNETKQLKLKIEENINKNNTINNELKMIKKANRSVFIPPLLLDYLREKFDTKTLVHNLGRCLFDFCATTEPARNKLRQIVREKLKLEVREKDYDIFRLEVIRQLQKFIDDYEKEIGRDLDDNSTEKVIPISKGLFSTKESKFEILRDILKIKDIINRPKKTDQKLHDFIDEFVFPLFEIYKKYNIIDNSLIQKINNLKNKSKQNMTFYQGENFKDYKKKKFKEVSEMLRPYQKKFLDSVINKNTRHKNAEKIVKINYKNKNIVNITNTPIPLKQSSYIVIKNEQERGPLNYIKYQNIPTSQRR